MARCPSCGHESDLDTYICDNCEYKLKEERIEAIPIFTRPNIRLYKPDNRFKRIYKVINPIKTPIAFRDINKKKDGGGPRFITWFNGFLIGLCALAVSWHLDIQLYQGVELTPMSISFSPFAITWGYKWVAFLNSFIIFLCFFIFGIIYYVIIFKLYNFAFGLAANFSVQLDGLLAIRYNVKLKKSKLNDMISGKSRLEKKSGIEGETSFQTSQKKDFMTKLSQTGKNKIMTYAYAPLIIINFISFLLIAIALPTTTLANTSGVTFSSISNTMSDIWSSKLWMVLDGLQLLGIIWVACTMSVAQREIGNTSTTRLLIGNMIMALIIGFTTIMLRPTFGANNWNIIESFTS
ncbi:hypothetical protein NEF87_001848 [Candidatus Lokiarchaeum ossiferum]|uniref:TFIIB-type zinc ribbon-containing protein n=1 Tax=Candidatus Lokiarchaeum ossiferum TaxID=2951803 RepID=A0ABY6HPX2_9ARCH|nr:hypothetical protein NEF87_001848 [Candidatus Lokiarchaeum sp. B-35]